MPGLAAYSDNSAIYFKTFWQPCHEAYLFDKQSLLDNIVSLKK